MRVWTGKLPSLGFVLVVLTYLGAGAFFAWGLHRPDLERVWTWQLELRLGQKGRLRPDERVRFTRALQRHPALVSALLDGAPIGLLSANDDGWLMTRTATILRADPAQVVRTLRLEVQTPPDLLPATAVLTAGSFQRRVTIESRGTMDIQLPPASGSPELLELRLRGRRFKADPSMIGLRVAFPEGP